MKELKEFTVEQLEQYSAITSWESLHSNVSLSDLRALAKIALAAKQAELAGRIEGWDSHQDLYIIQWFGNQQDLPKGSELYTTPPLNHTEQHMVVPDGFTEIQLIKAMTWINRVRAENPNMKEVRTCADLILRVLPAAPKPEM